MVLNPAAVSLCLGLACCGKSETALAQIPNPSQFGANLVSPVIANGMIKTIGILTDHRPYQPATPLGTSLGLDLGVEVTLSKVPADFYAAQAALGTTPTQIPIVPIPRFHLHKGFGPVVDLGASWISYQKYSVWGFDGKIAVANFEEGPTLAFRLNYTRATFDSISTTTWTPQVLVSRAIDFADPYIGVGYEYVYGTINYILDTPIGPIPLPEVTGHGAAFMAFLGVAFRVPYLGVKLTLEGSYNTSDAHTLGTKIGFNF